MVGGARLGVVVAMAVTHRSLVNNAKAKIHFFFWVYYINAYFALKIKIKKINFRRRRCVWL